MTRENGKLRVLVFQNKIPLPLMLLIQGIGGDNLLSTFDIIDYTVSYCFCNACHISHYPFCVKLLVMKSDFDIRRNSNWRYNKIITFKERLEFNYEICTECGFVRDYCGGYACGVRGKYSEAECG